VGGVSSLGEGLQKSKIVMMFLEGNSGVSWYNSCQIKEGQNESQNANTPPSIWAP
jgi:hypothetical protein